MLTSTPAPNSQSNFMTYDCLPEQQTTTPTGGIPLENLSIHHSIDNSNEWISDLNYSTGYSPQDMAFLFSYKDYAPVNKELSNDVVHSKPLQSAVSLTSDDIRAQLHQQHTLSTTPNKSNTDQQLQQRRYSMMDMTTTAQRLSFSTNTANVEQGAQWVDPLFYQQSSNNHRSHASTSDSVIHKERSSMPNVFMELQNIPTTVDSYLNDQQTCYSTAAGETSSSSAVASTSTANSFSWQQQDMLQKKPLSNGSNNSTPIKEIEQDMLLYDDLAKYTFNMPTTTYMTPSTSVSSPLKQHVKKRSIVEDILLEEEAGTMYATLPSVVSSLSEPIPTSTTTWTSQPVSRKRTKPSMRNSTQTPTVESHENYHLVASDILPPDTVSPTSQEYSNTHVLAALPRRQKLRYEGDHYTPKWVRYTGHLKEGYCDSCNPGKWLQLKNSAYWYHKQFYHGISSVSGKLFIKPIEQRMGKGDMIEGLCHQCHRYVPACNGKKKNNYMLWYRHAHKCHLYDKPKSTTKTNTRKLSVTSSSTSPVHTPSPTSNSSAYNA